VVFGQAACTWQPWLEIVQCRTSGARHGCVVLPRADSPDGSCEPGRGPPEEQSGPPLCCLATLPCPIEPEPFSVPSDNRFGLHDEQRRAPIRPDAGLPNPEQSVSGVERKSAAPRPVEDRELVAKSQNFNLRRCTRSKPRLDPYNHSEKRSKHGRGRLIRALVKINHFKLNENISTGNPPTAEI
jgi:hypothetical protein